MSAERENQPLFCCLTAASQAGRLRSSLHRTHVIEGITVSNRADVEELQDRAVTLEEKAGIEFRRRF